MICKYKSNLELCAACQRLAEQVAWIVFPITVTRNILRALFEQKGFSNNKPTVSFH